MFRELLCCIFHRLYNQFFKECIQILVKNVEIIDQGLEICVPLWKTSIKSDFISLSIIKRNKRLIITDDSSLRL